MEGRRRASRLAAALAAALLLASPGCSGGGAGGAGKAGPAFSFLELPPGLEVKKMEADARGVLWVLTYSREMYSLDPGLHLSPLPACGDGVEDFALEAAGERQDLATGCVYLAAGEGGLQRMDRAGERAAEAVPGVAVSVHADLSGGVYAGCDGGVFRRSGDGWERAWGDGAGLSGTPVRLAGSSGGLLCEMWENRLELLLPGEAGGLPVEVPGEKSFRVVELVEAPFGGLYLVTARGVYRLEGRELVAVRRSDDPVISASRIGGEDILLGKNSGKLTRLSPAAGTEEELASLGEPVEHVSASARGAVYARTASGIHYSGDLAYQPSRLVARAAFGVEGGSGRPAGLRLSLPSSDFLRPEWFYYRVKAGAAGVSWELERRGPYGLDLVLGGVSGRTEVEVLAAARRSDGFRLDPAGRYPFPDSFPEEARPYLLPMAGVPGDLPEIAAVLEGIPGEERGDMLAVLLRLARHGVFYLTACPSRALPPPPLTGAAGEEYARAAVARVLGGSGGDDYERALAFTALCRAAGIPARTALSFDRYLNQAYLYGVGWVPVDVSRPVYDFLAPNYPAVGALPGGEGSFITGTGGVDGGPWYAEPVPGGGAGAAAEPGATTLVFCRPSPFRLRDPAEAVTLAGGAAFHFEERGGEVLLVRGTRQGREETPVYQDLESFPLAEGLEANLRLVEGGYVMVEVVRGP